MRLTPAIRRLLVHRVDAGDLLQTVTIPGFEGSLKNVRYRGKLLSITATRWSI